MIAITEKRAKTYTVNPYKVAKNQTNKESIYIVPNAKVPEQTIDDPMVYITNDYLITLRKKYGISKSALNALKECYLKKEKCIHLKGDDIGHSLIIENIENFIIDRLKKLYINKKAKLLPFYNTQNAKSVGMNTSIFGSSCSGKTRIVTEICSQPEFDQVNFWIISPTAHKDKVILDFISDKKKRVKLIDLDLIEEDQKILTLADIKPYTSDRPICLIFDDCQGLPGNFSDKNYSLKSMVYKFINMCFIRARHLNCFSFYIGHDTKISSSLRSIRSQSHRIIFLHRFGNPYPIKKFMQTDLNIQKKEIDKIFKNHDAGRYLFINQSAPTFILSQQCLQLL